MKIGLQIDKQGLRNILIKLYETGASFPISSKSDLANALGGSATPVALFKGSVTSTGDDLASSAFTQQRNFESYDEFLNALVGGDYVNAVTKSVMYEDLSQATYPIPDPSAFEELTRGFQMYGVDTVTYSSQLNFPITDMDSLMSQLSSIDPDLFSEQVPMLASPLTISTAPAVMLKLGRSYLWKEDKPLHCYSDVSRAVERKYEILIVTRTHPEKLREEFPLGEAGILWLTDKESDKEMTVDPSLESLSYQLEEFLKNTENGMMVLDGLEFLISIHEFNPVLRFIRQLVDINSECQATMIIPVSPLAVGEQEIGILERELDILSGEDHFEIPMAETQDDREKRKELEGEMDEWRGDGYNVSALEIALRGDVNNAYGTFSRFQDAITEINEIKGQLSALEGEGVDDDMKGLEPLLRDPMQLPRIKEELQKIIQKVLEREKSQAEDAQAVDMDKEVEADDIAAQMTAELGGDEEAGGDDSAGDAPGGDLFEQAQNAMSNGDLEDALNLFKQVLIDDPDNKKAAFMLKKVQVKLGGGTTDDDTTDGGSVDDGAKAGGDTKDAALTPKPDVPEEERCTSCEGSGGCYWCKGTGKCSTCKGTGKSLGVECSACKGSGECRSCAGSGHCHWCKGTGRK